MGKTFSVAIREFVATVTTKGFLFGVVFFPILMAGAIPVIAFLAKGAAPTLQGEVAIIDHTGALTDLQTRIEAHSRVKKVRAELDKLDLPDALQTEQATAQLEQQEPDLTVVMLETESDVEAEKKVLYESPAEGEIARTALVVVPRATVYGERAETDEDAPETDAVPRLRYGTFELFVAPQVDPELQDQINDGVRDAIVEARIDADERVAAANLDGAYLRALLRGSSAKVKAVTEEGEKDTMGPLQILLPIAFMMLLWISVFTAGQYLLYSTIEEKASRVMEVLLSAVSPLQLMVGKILGQLGVGLIILVMYAGLGVGALIVFAQMHMIQWSDLFLLFVFFSIAFFTIACLMAAVGAAVNDVKEASALMGPIMTVLVIPMFLWMPVSRAPNAVFSQVLSFVPGINPFIMVVRISGSEDIPFWHIPASILVGLATVVALAWISAKIFRVGALMYGKPPDIRTLIRWVRMA